MPWMWLAKTRSNRLNITHKDRYLIHPLLHRSDEFFVLIIDYAPDWTSAVALLLPTCNKLYRKSLGTAARLAYMQQVRQDQDGRRCHDSLPHSHWRHRTASYSDPWQDVSKTPVWGSHCSAVRNDQSPMRSRVLWLSLCISEFPVSIPANLHRTYRCILQFYDLLPICNAAFKSHVHAVLEGWRCVESDDNQRRFQIPDCLPWHDALCKRKLQAYTVLCKLVLLDNIALLAWREQSQKYLSSSQKTVASFWSRNATRVAYLHHHLCHCPGPLPQTQSAKLQAVHHHSWPIHWIQTQGRCPETLLLLMVSCPSLSSMLPDRFPAHVQHNISMYDWRRTLSEE